MAASLPDFLDKRVTLGLGYYGGQELMHGEGRFCRSTDPLPGRPSRRVTRLVVRPAAQLGFRISYLNECSVDDNDLVENDNAR